MTMKKVYVDTLYAVNIIQNLEICISKLEKFITNAVNSESEKVMCDFEYKGMGKKNKCDPRWRSSYNYSNYVTR